MGHPHFLRATWARGTKPIDIAIRVVKLAPNQASRTIDRSFIAPPIAGYGTVDGSELSTWAEIRIQDPCKVADHGTFFFGLEIEAGIALFVRSVRSISNRWNLQYCFRVCDLCDIDGFIHATLASGLCVSEPTRWIFQLHLFISEL